MAHNLQTQLVEAFREGIMQKQISSSMSTKLIIVKECDTLESAYQVMKANKIRHLPVADARGAIVGLLSDRDLNRAMYSDVSENGIREETAFKPGIKVRDYMSWPVHSFDKAALLKTVVRKMIEEKTSSFLITDKEKIVGIVTTEDMLKVLENLLDASEESTRLNLEGMLFDPVFGSASRMISDIGI